MNTPSKISIVIVGAGHMGSALALGLKNSNLNISIIVIEPNPIRRASITANGICTQESMPELKNTKILLLAIPPQAFFSFTENCEKIKNYSGLVISVMAGLTISTLKKATYTTQICRAMPNISCAKLDGMTVLYYSKKTTNTNRALTNQLFSSLGKCLLLKKEYLIDSATALVGGGPAYVAYFATSLLNFATSNGFDKKSASLITTQIIRGTTTLLAENKNSPLNICKLVMTAKGTTEQAIKYFDKNKLSNLVIEGLNKACAQSKKIGEGR